MTETPEGGSTLATSIPPEDFSLLKDVPLTLQVHLGEATLTISDIMKCGKGSVIPLNQKVGDPFVIMLQQKPIAEGEVVEAGGQLGIKVTNVFRP
ncbi:MAG: FliM/FliN family flagellar motor switch protein [Deltaproteobacteria bacterium]|nr:MAG: FliM/FliN family flagellar motor switch protein [Deltaproteobacteria bacterium]